MSKLVSNPLKQPISIAFEGTVFSIPAEGKLVVEDRVAEFWKRTHAFIAVSAVEFKKEEVKEAVVEAPAEEVVAEAPVKEKKSKK